MRKQHFALSSSESESDSSASASRDSDASASADDGDFSSADDDDASKYSGDATDSEEADLSSSERNSDERSLRQRAAPSPSVRDRAAKDAPRPPLVAPPQRPCLSARALTLTEEEMTALRARRLSELVQRTTAITAALSEKLRVLAAARAALEEPTPPAIGGLLFLSPGRGLPAAALSADAALTAALEQPSLVSGTALRDYQLAGLRWLVSLHDAELNGILADEMGLGKTLQVLSLFAYLSEVRHEKGPFLVVVPLSVLSNWKADAVRFAPLLAERVHIHHGDSSERAPALADFFARVRDDARSAGADERLGETAVVLTTYELALRDAPLLRRRAWSYVVVDEGHRLKRGGSRLGEALRSLNAPRRLLLTGTPLQNSLDELWALLNFTLPTIFDCVAHFNEWFAAPFGVRVDDAALTLSADEQRLIVERLHAVLRPFLLRRVKADLQMDLLLPPCRKVELPCAMSALQVALYERARVGLRDFVDPASGRVKSLSLANLFMRLRQVCNHPSLLADEWLADSSLVRASGKFETLHRLLPKLIAAGHTVLIFSQMTSTLDLLEDLCEMVGLSWLRIDGNTHAEDRAAALARFAEPQATERVFLLSTRAGGLGVNLQTADTVILFDSDWNPQADLQAQARAHRIGQVRDVLVIRLVSMGPPMRGARGHTSSYAASVEELMLKRASVKLRTEAAVIGAGQFNHDAIARDCGVGGGAGDGAWGADAKRGSGLVAAVLAGRLRGEDGCSLLPAGSTPQPFDALNDAVINSICARSASDEAAFAKCDADRRLADEAALEGLQRVLASARRPAGVCVEGSAAVEAALFDIYCTPAAARERIPSSSLLAVGRSPRRSQSPALRAAPSAPLDPRLRFRLVQWAEVPERLRAHWSDSAVDIGESQWGGEER
jgi:superfamily II DNA or RNA helicase